MKLHRKVRNPKVSDFFTLPHEGIVFPSAPASGSPEEGELDLCGNTMTAAPVSMRNFCFELAPGVPQDISASGHFVSGTVVSGGQMVPHVDRKAA